MIDSFSLQLDSLTYGGSTIAHHDGRAIFVPYSLPGEHVLVRITRDKGSFAFAEITEILASSSVRITPQCPHFGPGRCGGCHYQHIDYAAQCAYKQQIVAEQLARIGGLRAVNVLPTIPSAQPWHYRSHATFHVTSQGQLAYVMTDDRTRLHIDACHIIRPGVADLFERLRSHDFRGAASVRLQVGSSDAERIIVISPSPGQHVNVDLPVPDDTSLVSLLNQDRARTLRGRGMVTYDIHQRSFRASAGSFFQVNLAQAETLVRLVVDFLNPQPHERLLDLYSGVGLFTVFLADTAREVVAIESTACAVEDARHNVAGFDNVHIVRSTAERALVKQRDAFAAAVVDPPRAGMKPEALDALIALAPAKIAYVSCDPTTLARDAKRLTAAGYTMLDVQPVDMFPQTYHIEAVARFART